MVKMAPENAKSKRPYLKYLMHLTQGLVGCENRMWWKKRKRKLNRHGGKRS